MTSHNQYQTWIALVLRCQSLTSEDDTESPLTLCASDVVSNENVEKSGFKLEITKIPVHGVKIGAKVIYSHSDAGYSHGDIHGGQA
jgi:hypothetical protein